MHSTYQTSQACTESAEEPEKEAFAWYDVEPRRQDSNLGEGNTP